MGRNDSEGWFHYVMELADVGLVASATESRSFVGTEGFIPPEGPGTPQADISSLGIVLYPEGNRDDGMTTAPPLPV